MKRATISSLAVLSLALGGCGPVELILSAEIDVLDPETGTTVTRSVEDVELQLLPFDRDQIFASPFGGCILLGTCASSRVAGRSGFHCSGPAAVARV